MLIQSADCVWTLLIFAYSWGNSFASSDQLSWLRQVAGLGANFLPLSVAEWLLGSNPGGLGSRHQC